MKIRKIKIKNFRNLQDIEIYPKNITVIVGENNTGKTNLLHALRLLLDPDSKRLESELSEEDINDNALLKGENNFTITIEIGDLQKHQELEAIFRDRISLDGQETYITIEGKYQPDEDGIYTWTSQLLPQKGRSNEPIILNNRMARSIPLYFLYATRDAEREVKTSGRGTLSQLLKDVNLDDVEPEIISHIQNANTALKKNQDINDCAKGITDFLLPHIPGGQGEVSLSVANESPNQLIKGLRLNIKRHLDQRTYDITRHGTGLQNLLLIAMFRHKISKSDINQPILAIEEPEAHLHPQAQRSIFKDLKEIANPVILTTHSSTIVECSDPLSIIRLKSSFQNYVTAHQINISNCENNDNELLARLMRLGGSSIFFAKAIIIVEGPSEVIALPAFAEYLGYNLDRDGVSVIAAHSNSFSYILRFCKDECFSIPSIVTFDTDALKANDSLLKEACKLKLINEENLNMVKVADIKKKILTLMKIGWIPVIENSEYQLARIGYLPSMLKSINEQGLCKSYKDFLNTHNLNNDPCSISQFIHNHTKLKIPIAHQVTEDLKTIGCIPNCFKKAIKQATTMARGY